MGTVTYLLMSVAMGIWREPIAFLDAHQPKQDGCPFFIYLPLNAAHDATLPPAATQKLRARRTDVDLLQCEAVTLWIICVFLLSGLRGHCRLLTQSNANATVASGVCCLEHDSAYLQQMTRHQFGRWSRPRGATAKGADS